MLILEVALGIVFAVVILNFLPAILWLVTVIGGIAVLALILAVAQPGTAVFVVLFVMFSVGLAAIRGR